MTDRSGRRLPNSWITEPRQVEVEEHRVEIPLSFRAGQALAVIARLQHFRVGAELTQQRRHPLAHHSMIVDDEKLHSLRLPTRRKTLRNIRKPMLLTLALARSRTTSSTTLPFASTHYSAGKTRLS